MEHNNSVTMINILLSTRLPGAKFRAADGLELAVPATFGRRALSDLVNRLLSPEEEQDKAEEDPDKQQFEFLIQSSLLRTTLFTFCERAQWSLEKTLEIEYTLPFPNAKERKKVFASNDWVSCMDWNDQSTRLLAGFYNGTVEVLDCASSKEILPSKSIRVVPVESSGSQCIINDALWVRDMYVAAACQNGNVYIINAETEAENGKCFNSNGQDAASLATSATCLAKDSRNSLYTGYADGKIEAYDLNQLDVNVQATYKSGGKRKALESETPATRDISPKHELSSASACASVTSISLANDATLLSASSDGTIASWDLNKQVLVNTIPAGMSKYITGMSLCSTKPSIGVCSCFDGALRVFDLQSPGNVVCSVLRPNVPSGQSSKAMLCVQWAPDQEFYIQAGGKDGCLYVWDTRSSRVPVHKFENAHGPQGSVTCVQWSSSKDDDLQSFSGGSDGKIAQYRFART